MTNKNQSFCGGPERTYPEWVHLCFKLED